MGVRYSLRTLVAVGRRWGVKPKGRRSQSGWQTGLSYPEALTLIIANVSSHVSCSSSVCTCFTDLRQLSVKPERMFVHRLKIYSSLCQREIPPYWFQFFDVACSGRMSVSDAFGPAAPNVITHSDTFLSLQWCWHSHIVHYLYPLTYRHSMVHTNTETHKKKHREATPHPYFQRWMMASRIVQATAGEN